MIKRFQDVSGKPRLIEALKRQVLLRDDPALAAEFADKVELLELKANQVLIEQKGDDDDIYFIVTGTLSIVVHGREVAIRKSGQHVGEMALIDSTEPRCASVIAIEDSVVGKVSEQTFSQVANRYPRLWRLLASELCVRLRQRNTLVRPSNPRPVLFIGSSSEGLEVANQLQAKFDHGPILAKVWTDDTFRGSEYPMESLQREVERADFAILVLGPDDKVTSRKKQRIAPRDNVIFELGLFMGALSRQRTFLLQPRGLDLKIPSDLHGLNPFTYVTEPKEDLPSNLGAVSTAIRDAVNRLGTK